MCIDTDFDRFHTENPQVFEAFKRFANDARVRGHRNYSAKTIIERIRWHLNIETHGDAEFKINNNYTSRYARLLENTDPRFNGFFRMRELRS